MIDDSVVWAAMPDAEFARAFERGDVPKEHVHHRDHLRLAWVYLRECSTVEQATARIGTEIRRFAARIGKPEKYHETLTAFWMQLLASARDESTVHPVNLADALDAHPWLLDPNAALGYYSRERLYSARASVEYVPPDLREIGQSENAASHRL